MSEVRILSPLPLYGQLVQMVEQLVEAQHVGVPKASLTTIILIEGIFMDIGIWENIEYVGKFGKDKKYAGICKFCGLKRIARLKDFYTAKKCIHDRLHIKNKRIRSIFYGMIRRCYKKEDRAYKWYGEKGIKICDKWKNNPEEFEKWSIENGYNDELTIDRIDSNGDYCPENCRWITLSENDYYANSNFIEVDGVSKSGREWSRFLGLDKNYINKKIREKGKENTIEFIRRVLKCGIPDESICNKKYYDYIMNE